VKWVFSMTLCNGTPLYGPRARALDEPAVRGADLALRLVPARPQRLVQLRLPPARKVLGRPRRCELTRAFPWGRSYINI
jgi:hypothetical protein